MQLALVSLGGLYELAVLSEYGMRETHGRSSFFWRGEALDESAIRKGVTQLSKLTRRCRNLICVACLSLVSVLDPLLSSFFGSESAGGVTSLTVRGIVLGVLVPYSVCLMYEETK